MITWKLATDGQESGGGKGDATGSVEFVVRMPQLPDQPEFVDGVFSAVLWNQAYLDWTEKNYTDSDAPQVDARTAAVVEETVDGHLESNEVIDEARAFEPAPPDPC